MLINLKLLPPNITPSPPDSPKLRLTKVLSSTLSSFQARWTRCASSPAPADQQLVSTPSPSPTSPTPPEIIPMHSPDFGLAQEPMIIKESVRAMLPLPNSNDIDEIQPVECGSAVVAEMPAEQLRWHPATKSFANGGVHLFSITITGETKQHLFWT